MTFGTNVALGWLLRRIPDVGGWLTAVLSIYAAMPPDLQAAVWDILQGKGGALTLTAYAGLAAFVWGQFQSFRATTQTQIVADGQKVVPAEAAKPQVKTAAQQITPKRRKTLLDALGIGR